MREVGRPACVDPETWADLPEGCRGEATARMAWLVLRGLPPAEAFDEALAGMVRDEADPDIERMPSWDMLRAACEAWVGHARRLDGSAKPEVLALACIADGLVEAAVERPDVDQDVEGVLSQYCTRPRTVSSLTRHVQATIAERMPEPVPEEAQAEGPIEAGEASPAGWRYSGMETDSFGLSPFTWD